MNKLSSGFWTVAALVPLVTVALILAAQTIFTLDARQLWFSDEIRYGNVFEHVIMAKKWLVMYLNGVPYPDKPPVYFWFMALFLPLFGGPVPALFFATAAASALLLLGATLTLNRCVAGGDRHDSLATGLILLTCFYFIGLAHYSRMDLLFATFITLSQVCLFRAFGKDRAPLLVLAGFALAALATLTKGPLGLVFPLVTSLVFLGWTGNIKRFLRRDIAMGLGLALLILGAWVAGAWFMGEKELVHNIFYKQIYRRAVNASHHEQPFWHYFATLPASWMPWTLVLFVLPLKQLFTGAFWKGVWSSRKEEGRGAAFLWVQVLTGFLLLSCLSTKIIVYLLPIFPPLAILTARAVTRLDEAKTSRLFLLLAGLFALLGGLLLTFALPFVNIPGLPVKPAGLWWLAGGAALIAVVLCKVCRGLVPRAGLLIFTVLLSLWFYPVARITAPSLDAVMSPKAQAEVMGAYIQRGYIPAAYKIYSGIYTYYAGTNILETQDLELLARMAQEEPKLILAMQKKYFERWENRPADLRIVHEQWLVDRPYVLAVKGPLLWEGDTAFTANKIMPAFADAPFAPRADAPSPDALDDSAPSAKTPPAHVSPDPALEPEIEPDVLEALPLETEEPAAVEPEAIVPQAGDPAVSESEVPVTEPVTEAAPEAQTDAPKAQPEPETLTPAPKGPEALILPTPEALQKQ